MRDSDVDAQEITKGGEGNIEAELIRREPTDGILSRGSTLGR